MQPDQGSGDLPEEIEQALAAAEQQPPSADEPDLTVTAFLRGAPIGTITATIGLVLGTLVLLWFLRETSRILIWMLIAAFFAVVLTPPVEWLVRRLRMRRGLAVTVVFVLGLGLLGGLGYTFVKPITTQGTEFADRFPTYVQDAQNGKGQMGRIVKRYKLDTWLEKNQDELRRRAREFLEPKRIFGIAVAGVGTVFTALAGVLTVLVMTFLMLLQGQELLVAATRLLDDDQRRRLLAVANGSARAITGYVNGNLLISVFCGAATYVCLWFTDVPFAVVLALWVAFADLIPLVGATMGAIPTILVAFLHSTGAGIVVLVFYAIYQQFENHVLQPTIMSRTVALRPLVILLAVLLGVELAGLLGALLAIPAAGVVKVIGADILAHRRPDLLVVEHVHPHRTLRHPLRRR